MRGVDRPAYRIEYSVQRRLPGDDDFTEIGFGSSGEWSSVDQAGHMVESALQNREWEHLSDQPDPREVDQRD